jgi:hypothetical protein
VDQEQIDYICGVCVNGFVVNENLSIFVVSAPEEQLVVVPYPLNCDIYIYYINIYKLIIPYSHSINRWHLNIT